MSDNTDRRDSFSSEDSIPEFSGGIKMSECEPTEFEHEFAPPAVPVQLQPKTPQKRGVCGIFNMGNTCYANAAIQMLRAIPEFSAFCNSNPVALAVAAQDAPKANRILSAYADLSRTLWSATSPVSCRPAAFLNVIRDVVRDTPYDQFGTRMPNDAHEYLMYLLDQFNEAIKGPCPAAAADASPAIKAWCNIWVKEYSELTNLFFGLDRVVCRCLTCGNESERFEVFNTLKVNPESGVSLEELLGRDREPERLEGYACEKCAPVQQPAEIRRTIWHLPPVLFVAVRRFNGDGRSKNHAPVQYDGTDLSLERFFDAASTDASRARFYEPIAVVDHHGSGFGGHYTAQAYNIVEKAWYFYDDDGIQNLEKPMFGGPTYIICFRARSSSSGP